MTKRLWLIILLAAALVTGAIFATVFREWVRTAIVLPVAYLFWIAGLVIQTVDQAVYWGILIAICCLITIYALLPGSLRPGQSEPSRPGSVHSRYHQWYSYFNNLEESRFAGDSLAREMVRFTVQILAFQQNLSPDEVYSQIDRGAIDLPEDFLAFLRRREFINKPRPEPGWLEFIHQYIPSRRKTHSAGNLSPIEKEAESVLRHIEMLISPQEIDLEAPIDQSAPQHANS